MAIVATKVTRLEVVNATSTRHAFVMSMVRRRTAIQNVRQRVVVDAQSCKADLHHQAKSKGVNHGLQELR